MSEREVWINEFRVDSGPWRISKVAFHSERAAVAHTGVRPDGIELRTVRYIPATSATAPPSQLSPESLAYNNGLHDGRKQVEREHEATAPANQLRGTPNMNSCPVWELPSDEQQMLEEVAAMKIAKDEHEAQQIADAVVVAMKRERDRILGLSWIPLHTRQEIIRGMAAHSTEATATANPELRGRGI